MITNITENDIEIIEDLENKFPNVFLKNDILKDFKNNPYTKYLVYLIEGKVVGFINYYMIYERMEIVNFNVLDFFQNKKIGSSILEELLKIAKDKKVGNITLEVIKDNVKAIHIYSKYGFKEVAIRKNYYNNTDGILMECELM